MLKSGLMKSSVASENYVESSVFPDEPFVALVRCNLAVILISHYTRVSFYSQYILHVFCVYRAGFQTCIMKLPFLLPMASF